MLHKTFDLLESKTDAETGTFEATVAVFGNVDRGNDRIMPGAFKGTLAAWEASGDPIPVILSHQWDNPMAHVGVVDAAKETDKGLWVKGRLDVADNEVAKQVHRLMARRSLKEFSFGYEVPKGGQKRAKDGANELLEIELAEVGPTLKGMNPATELHAVKSALDDEAPDSQRRRATQAEREANEDQFPKVPEAEPGPMAKAFAGFNPADMTAEQVASTLDGLELHTGEVLFVRLVSGEEREGVKSGEIKAVWSAAYVNALPDSAFLYVEPGGEKDGEGKTTPRSLRHFPVKDADGKVDLAHLRNALSRIPQSSLSQGVKDRLTATAQRMLDNMKSVDETDKEPKARSVDPLRKQAESVALEFASDGLSLQTPPRKVAQPNPEPELALRDLKRRMRDEILMHLSGDTI